MNEPRPMFGDGVWCWARPIIRRRIQVHDYLLDLRPPRQWWQYALAGDRASFQDRSHP